MAELERLGSEGSWGSYRRLVLSELERLSARDDKIAAGLNEKLDKLFAMVEKQGVHLASLEVKSRIWGMLGGLIPVVVTLAILLISKLLP